MTTDNHKTSQSEEFVDLTLNRARRSLKNTTIVLWAIFSLLIAYFIGLNYLLVKSTKTVVEIGEAYGVTSNNWKTVKGYIEQLPDIKEEIENLTSLQKQQITCLRFCRKKKVTYQ